MPDPAQFKKVQFIILAVEFNRNTLQKNRIIQRFRNYLQLYPSLLLNYQQ